jgi:class 3 adenylate cyclase
VLISEATARLVQGLFECHAHGPQVLKGVSTPVPLYRVLRESEARKFLAEIYGWFTEGLDTKDLQETKALLEELS